MSACLAFGGSSVVVTGATLGNQSKTVKLLYAKSVSQMFLGFSGGRLRNFPVFVSLGGHGRFGGSLGLAGFTRSK